MRKGKEESIYQKFSAKVEENASENKTSGVHSNVQAVQAAPASKPSMPEYQQLQRRPLPAADTKLQGAVTKVAVHIGGMQYHLSVADTNGEAHIREIAEKADLLIRQIQKNMPGTALTSVTVLALVNALDELSQRDLQMKELEAAQVVTQSTIEVDKANYLHLREINWELKKEVVRLQEIVRSYEYPEEHEDDNNKQLLPLEELAYDRFE